MNNILYDSDLGKLVMCESDYVDQKFYITDFKVGAIGFLFEDNGPAIALVVKKIFARSENPDAYDYDLHLLNDEIHWNYDYSIEFITDRDCYYVGFNIIGLKDIEVAFYC